MKKTTKKLSIRTEPAGENAGLLADRVIVIAHFGYGLAFKANEEEGTVTVSSVGDKKALYRKIGGEEYMYGCEAVMDLGIWEEVLELPCWFREKMEYYIGDSWYLVKRAGLDTSDVECNRSILTVNTALLLNDIIDYRNKLIDKTTEVGHYLRANRKEESVPCNDTLSVSKESGLCLDIKGRYRYFKGLVPEGCKRTGLPEWFKVGNIYYGSGNKFKVTSIEIDENKCFCLSDRGPYNIELDYLLNNIFDHRELVLRSME